MKNWSQYLQYLQSYLEIFICHLAAAVLLLETDIYSKFVDILSRYDLFLWLVPEKNCVLLVAFWDKRSIFHLGQTEFRSARGDGPICAQHHALISFV